MSERSERIIGTAPKAHGCTNRLQLGKLHEEVVHQ